MKSIFVVLLLTISIETQAITDIKSHCISKNNIYSWTVIGAGPSGLASIEKLIDSTVPEEKICWIDPDFQVGDFGKKWNQVPSNTPSKYFKDYLSNFKCFEVYSKNQFTINSIPDDEHCLLECAAEPMRTITKLLRKKVRSIETLAESMKLEGGCWHITTFNQNTILSKNVILCIGSEPKTLKIKNNIQPLSLEIALNPTLLKKHITPSDTVGVIGSSHSAVLVLKNLHELKIKKVFNFYRSAQRYCISYKDSILFENSGLKGIAAKWSKTYIDGILPENMHRFHIHDKGFDEALSKCDKIVFAIGFEKRDRPFLPQFPMNKYQNKTGIIGPGLFGLGIAFPRLHPDLFGNFETQIGVLDFACYLNQIFPLWLSYSIL